MANELKGLSDDVCPVALPEFMLPEYTHRHFDLTDLKYANRVILHDLNKNMRNVFPIIRDETRSAATAELPSNTESWQGVDLVRQILRLTCRVAERAFVGQELASNEEWIDICCNYPTDVFLSAVKLRAVPAILRPLVAACLPDLRRVHHHHQRAEQLIGATLRRRDMEAVDDAEKRREYSDAIQWVNDTLPPHRKGDIAFQGVAQLDIATVSLQTTSKLIANVLLNLTQYPEYMSELVDEIENVRAAHGGVWTLESMSQLQKLDSFMKESLRYETLLMATFQRRAKMKLTLSDGTVIPKDTLMFAPAVAISLDSDIYSDPEKFDGLRFYKMRSLPPNDAASQPIRPDFVATGKTAMHFGLGRHACPGRWFASHLVKMVVAHVLLNYDLRFKDGEERRKAFVFQTTNLPDPTTRILMRRKTIACIDKLASPP